ncbi:MAG: hypothetical protein R2778_10345 [Saprospiraceae bacterium]
MDMEEFEVEPKPPLPQPARPPSKQETHVWENWLAMLLLALSDLTDLRNNVMYNWGANSCYGGEAKEDVNIVNCYYKPGPASVTGKNHFH